MLAYTYREFRLGAYWQLIRCPGAEEVVAHYRERVFPAAEVSVGDSLQDPIATWLHSENFWETLGATTSLIRLFCKRRIRVPIEITERWLWGRNHERLELAVMTTLLGVPELWGIRERLGDTPWGNQFAGMLKQKEIPPKTTLIGLWANGRRRKPTEFYRLYSATRYVLRK